MNDILNLLLTRRSVLAKDIIEPGPSETQIESILSAAHRVPDHGKIGPWRFILFKGEAREKFGKTLRTRFTELNPDASEKLLGFEEARFTRAPLVIAVVANIDKEHPKIPIWEQQLAVGACCQNLLLAVTALGFAGQWLTEWYAYDDDINSALELKCSERIAGYFYIGSKTEVPNERVRPELKERIKKYEP